MELDPRTPVCLHPALQLIHDELTESACRSVFQQVRVAERERKWTLHHLVVFWTEVILRAPKSLSDFLKDLWNTDRLETTDEAFFQRCRDLSWRFFAGLYSTFVVALQGRAPAAYAPDLHHLRESFAHVWILDGSRLDQIARSLKILRHLKCTVLPGCIMAAYDLFRGFAQRLVFDPDAATNEAPRAIQLFGDIPEDTLLVGDRAGGIPRIFQALAERKLWGLFRWNPRAKLKRLKLLARTPSGDTTVEEWLVEAGLGSTTPVQTLRLIHRRRPGFDLLTNVLDPARLSGIDALALYRQRWSVEKLFYQLKCVLNLRHFYAANPNAIAMQVYAAALVHTAMRVTQARLSEQLEIEPDRLSTERLYLRLAAGSKLLAEYTLALIDVEESNPGLDFKRPTPARHLTIPVGFILKDRGSPTRVRRRRVWRAGKWKSFRHVAGGSRFLT